MYCLATYDVGIVTPKNANKPNTSIIDKFKDFGVHPFVLCLLSFALCSLQITTDTLQMTNKDLGCWW
jgi:hypothetical protein